MKIWNWMPHAVVLALLSLAEGSRLFEFYRTLTGNTVAGVVAGVASAGVTVAIVLYLAVYRYKWTSRWATFLCIVLSLASYVAPVQEEYTKIEQSRPVKELKSYPVWNPKLYWNGGGEAYSEAFKAETADIKRENERILTENSIIHSEQELSLYFYHLLLAAGVLAICVPILNYLVSHKIAELLRNYDAGCVIIPGSPFGLNIHAASAYPKPKRFTTHGPGEDGITTFPSPENLRNHPELAERMKTVAGQEDDISEEPVVSHGFSDSDDNKPPRGEDPNSRNAEIKRLKDGGIPAPDIARKFGLSRQQVYKILKRMSGIESERPQFVFA